MAFSLFRHSLPTRLWIGASLLGAFILTITAGNMFLSRQRSIGRSMLGYDFLAFYTAGHFLNTGRPENVYDLPALRSFQEAEARRWGLELHGTYGPFWNPPFYAWIFRPLARLPFPIALHVWWAVNLACCALALAILWRLLPDRSWKSGGLVVALVVVSLPFSQALMHAQNTFTSLLILAVATRLWLAAACQGNWRGLPLSSPMFPVNENVSEHRHHGRDAHATRFGRPRAVPGRTCTLLPPDLLAGLVAGLMVYKPQLAMAVAAAMAITLGRRAILGMVLTGGGLVAMAAIFSPDLLGDWLTRMPSNLQWFQETNHYRWERHITFKGFWRLLLQGHTLGTTSTLAWSISAGCMLGMAALILGMLIRARREINRPDTPAESRRSIAGRMIAATFLGMPLLMPFYFDYDLLLLAIPGTLLAADFLAHRSDSSADRWIVRVWMALYVWTLLGSSLAGLLRLQLSVPLLASLTLLQCARCRREAAVVRPETNIEEPHRAIAA
ncbi:MAG: glycosyltransferase family 87 protein [Tepidisphaeraceae bacterium]|jgi:hypothetical protein